VEVPVVRQSYGPDACVGVGLFPLPDYTLMITDSVLFVNRCNLKSFASFDGCFVKVTSFVDRFVNMLSDSR
jgi:hypothetical protein